MHNYLRFGDKASTLRLCAYYLQRTLTSRRLRRAGRFLLLDPRASMRWSFPGETPAGEVQAFHRDSEAGSFKILVYLTDVDMQSGPHRYVPGSHQERMPLRLRPYSDADIARDYGAGVPVTGAAGTAFAIDTRGIHKGVPPVARPRLLLCIQYSLLPCLIYDYAPVVREGVTVDPYINRLIVRAQA